MTDRQSSGGRPPGADPTQGANSACTDTPSGIVWRVGYVPSPWGWTDWSRATDGRFNGRWDDPSGNYRTTYAGDTPFACYVEVLAHFRVDPPEIADMAEIDVDPYDAEWHPTIPAGTVDMAWLENRRLSSATLDGVYFDLRAAQSISFLRPYFIAHALRDGFEDFDAAALKDKRARGLTQAISAWLYVQVADELPVYAGVRFSSRHGEDLGLWAVFERPADIDQSRNLAGVTTSTIDPDSPDIAAAMRLHKLEWAPVD